MSSSELLYSFPFSTPDYIQRARTQVLRMPAYYQGQLVAPSAGTFTLLDASGVAIVSAAAVTITGSVATYSLLNTAIPSTIPLGDGWVEFWALTMPDGTVRTARRTAAIALYELFPTVSLADARALQSNVDQLLLNAQDPTGQDKLAFIWGMVNRKIGQGGKKPYLILNPEALVEIVLNGWLWLINRDNRSSVGDGTYKELALEYKEAFDTALKETQILYDVEEDGRPEADQSTETVQPPVFLSAMKPGRWF
jgi:hypothetical protein